jgi:hypothetical protein
MPLQKINQLVNLKSPSSILPVGYKNMNDARNTHKIKNIEVNTIGNFNEELFFFFGIGVIMCIPC